ncbi:DUF397 domain-containing protein [Streptomyces sp. DT24]|uniref:DUF397 domain-containing protein n=1 Tax=unclassified Streptomyces TaxID=2593676 RepID=UPI0023B892D3|nr:DUF397 domain-containing protein [Streptomyces sp. AM 4-1-1]WEH33593.1 DUF397 domain-containing protein [Streptomyces sp. AM 4-1-1]
MIPVAESGQAPMWFKSSHSGGNTTECVEVAYLPHLAAVRDSKDSDGPRLAFGRSAWARFVSAVGEGPAEAV